MILDLIREIIELTNFLEDLSSSKKISQTDIKLIIESDQKVISNLIELIQEQRAKIQKLSANITNGGEV